MTLDFEELGYHATPMGELTLRRRVDPRIPDQPIYEIKLGDEFLMSSLFTEGEEALADLALEAMQGEELDVVVGGLGLGYTAQAALRRDSVQALLVIEVLEGVIDWHRRELVPLGRALTNDPRCRLVHGDFFALADDPEQGFDRYTPGRRFDAVLVDIDHSPRHQLEPGSRSLYEAGGLRRITAHLKPGGVFALWSNDAPDEGFEAVMDKVFTDRRTHVVRFDNPYTGGESASTVYIGRT